ncbi:hypothetical protein Dform_00605 [Dehalogenimonas formicexedens]|uniref:Uncharacterized protein n=1 Tax=Dehalogenimonas formicexedens TaxID=1839801 RepID=A0A1P8F695_9CHLR|nr:hypothetical protein Dform_00605 [Dehalogenimonas formicexedens]
MFVIALILSIASLIGAVLFLVIDRAAERWSVAVPPWTDAISNTEPRFEGGSLRNV